MSATFRNRLARLVDAAPAEVISGGRKGLEKESLRVTPQGHIAQSPHPSALSAPLTHPHITTDYSEAMIEFITSPYEDIRDALAFLSASHQFAFQHLGEELLWATSMPCVVDGEKSIPIARYGRSNAGRLRHIYRVGLGYRYGKLMQVIAGVHFNFSVPARFWPVFQELVGNRDREQDFVSSSYFALIRNLQRLGWLPLYLFGASPALCKSFFAEGSAMYRELDAHTVYEPYATSLRMSDIGYSNKSPGGLRVSYENLERYIATLSRATETPYPPYERIGVVVDGKYRQLSANILQIENEYYSTVRPKRSGGMDDKPSTGLRRFGVEYVELRSVDVNPFSPIGVNEHQLRFLEALVLYCLLSPSGPISTREREAIDYNQSLTAVRGREPKLALRYDDRARPLREWAAAILEEMQGVSELLDASQGQGLYADALNVQKEAIAEPGRTPSARVLDELAEAREPFFAFAMRCSEAHRRYFSALDMDKDCQYKFETMASESWRRQREIESADDLPFEDYLHRYFH